MLRNATQPVRSRRPKAASAERLDPRTAPGLLYEELATQIIGLEKPRRTLCSRLAIHLSRAAQFRERQKPRDGNQCLLVIGPSGTGKTYLIESAARLARLPFVAANSSQITAEGYVGNNINDILTQLVNKAGGTEDARFGIAFFDEWDKRVRAVAGERDFARGVQGEILRIMEGTTLDLGSRRASRSGGDMTLNTRGMMFVFAGVFEGVGECLQQQRKFRNSIGFDAGSERLQRLTGCEREYQALQEFGLMPEFLNRLTGILWLEAPDRAALLTQLTRPGGILAACNSRLAHFGSGLALTPAAAEGLVAHVLGTRTYYRGLKLLLQGAMDDLVFRQMRGVIELSADDMDRLMAGEELLVEDPAEPTGKAAEDAVVADVKRMISKPKKQERKYIHG